MNDAALRIERLWVCLGAVGAAVLWILLAGQDLSWDLHNHQIYLPFSLLSGRFSTDLLAAGPQSTQHPLGYLPHHLLLMLNAPAWTVGAGLAAATAALHAYALHRLAVLLLGSSRAERDWRLVAVALGLVAPVHLLVIGTAFNDPWCSALILLALATVMDDRPRSGPLAGAGLACGLAVVIKPTSVVFVLPMAALLAGRVVLRQCGPRDAAIGAGAAILAFALVGGPWAYWLWTEFGSPTYPLLNQWFHSDMAPQGATSAMRFLPSSWVDGLTRPFAMAQFKAFVVVESFAPDMRPAAAVLAGLVAAAMAASKGLTGMVRSPLAQLSGLVVVCYGLWLLTSGNGRYAMALFLLLGPLLVALARRISPSRAILLGLTALLVVQAGVYGADGDRRVDGRAWTAGPIAPYVIPERLKREPFLHLSLGVQSHAAAAVWMHPEGAFINLIGQMSLPPDGPLGQRLADRLKRWEGRTRVLFAARASPGSPHFVRSVEDLGWSLLNRHGLRIDTDDCEAGYFHTTHPEAPLRNLVSCRAFPSPQRDPGYPGHLADADVVFKLIEAACPQVYSPRPFVSDANPRAVWRRYMNSDTVIEISPVDGVLVSHHRAPSPIYLGQPEQVIENQGKEGCTAWNKLTAQQ